MTNPMPRRAVSVLVAVLSIASVLSATPAAASQNDAGSGTDAGNSFASATLVPTSGRYSGTLDTTGGDNDDFYRFFLPAGASVSVLIETPARTTDPITVLDPNGVPVDTGAAVFGQGAAAATAFTGEPAKLRLAVHRAVVEGEYRLHLRTQRFALGTYSFCFMNCEGTQSAPIDFIFGGSLPTAQTRVLLVPPSHGDLGNPLGPTVTDYIDATLRGMRRWKTAMAEFARDYPQYDYLRDIEVEIEVFDGVSPVDPAGYEVIIGYVAAGPAFRGVATDTDDWTQGLLDNIGAGRHVRYSGRYIALSLFGSSPRAGQVAYDFPELADLEMVTMHEFGHTFGLGHTTTWDPVLGFDLMNSPAAFVYGDGSAAGDGGERTTIHCLTSLNLYGMAVLYRWLDTPAKRWERTTGSARLPGGIPYRWYCPE
ncbi:MAG TPA: hypothetical protein VNE62_01780 [Actinomycetota bacterium]|nr:hypothetical protein [Actinomycetota bacterium]